MKKTDCLAYGATLLAIASACLCARAGTIEWTPGDLVIPAGDTLTITTPFLTNTSVTVHGNFTIQHESANAFYNILAEDPSVQTTSHLAPDPGDVAVWKMGRGRIYGYYNNAPKANLVIGANGGGNGLLHMGAFSGSPSSTTSINWFRNITLSANAVTEAESFEPFIVDSSSEFMCNQMINDNSKPLCIAFTNQWNVTRNYYRYFGGHLTAFWGASLFSLKKPGGDIVLRGLPDAPVILKGWSGQGFNMFDANAGNRKALVRFEGDCEVWFCIENSWCIFNATNVAYKHSGDTRFIFPSANGGYIRTLVADVLPWGPGTGNLVIETVGNGEVAQKNLDLHGCSQKLNGLVINGEAHLVNTNEAVTLTFGTGDTDGKLSGLITNETVVCEKVGAGTLSLENADVHSLVATNGGEIVVAAGSNHVHSLTIDVPLSFANGATLTADEWHVGANALTSLDGSTQTNVVHLAFPAVHGMPCIKEGDNFVTYATPDDAQGGALSVRGGTLRFGGVACTNAWWRFVVKKASSDVRTFTSDQAPGFSRDVTLALGTLGMFSPEGLYSVKYFSNASSGTEAASLAQGQVASARPWMSWNKTIFTNLYPSATSEPILTGGDAAGGPRVFVGQNYWNDNRYDFRSTSGTDCWINYWPNAVLFTNGVIRVDDPSTWETLTWRMDSSWGRASASYALKRCVNNDSKTMPHPVHWALESSADGVVWETMDERTNQTFTLLTEAPYLSPQFNYTYNAHVPYLFSAKNANWKFKTFGTVEVAVGATLDLSEIPMTNIAFNALSVDCAGAGRITRFRPAESGTLYVTSSAATRANDGRLLSTVVLPLELVETDDMANLSSWSVVVDGQPARASRAACADGHIVVYTHTGTMMIFR